MSEFVHRVRREAEQREKALINGLIARFRAETLEDREAMLVVAQISGLRVFVNTLEAQQRGTDS
jgi:hypothetical protein